jgi:hypothetical protein
MGVSAIAIVKIAAANIAIRFMVSTFGLRRSRRSKIHPALVCFAACRDKTLRRHDCILSPI